MVYDVQDHPVRWLLPQRIALPHAWREISQKNDTFVSRLGDQDSQLPIFDSIEDP